MRLSSVDRMALEMSCTYDSVPQALRLTGTFRRVTGVASAAAVPMLVSCWDPKKTESFLSSDANGGLTKLLLLPVLPMTDSFR